MKTKFIYYPLIVILFTSIFVSECMALTPGEKVDYFMAGSIPAIKRIAEKGAKKTTNEYGKIYLNFVAKAFDKAEYGIVDEKIEDNEAIISVILVTIDTAKMYKEISEVITSPDLIQSLLELRLLGSNLPKKMSLIKFKLKKKGTDWEITNTDELSKVIGNIILEE